MPYSILAGLHLFSSSLIATPADPAPISPTRYSSASAVSPLAGTGCTGYSARERGAAEKLVK